ncbi:Uncharacterized membrane protein YeiH [Pseudomonas pohangensis]|uniref:Uncharacterized membrane protein YeiH n=1 Tax=Pseudomonas pohangensis TaxID=364197 RepID=A0A1H2EDX4_9PSED|nr:trimeric intracellular cation channel family protein [Pseudomonas pohangensis]SDT93347.1 Uncharacterized membrane protein YeiH [Pseudomonas pohangensis]
MTINYVIGMAATAAFAMSGVLAVARKDMDVIGLTFMGVVTAIGGGTLRDLLLDTPVFWVVDFNFVWIAIVASLLAFSFERYMRAESVLLAILYLDAFGIALFGVQAIDKALLMEFSAPVAVVMATLTAIGGGLIRDVLAQRQNLLLSHEIYVSTIIAGSLLYLGLLGLFGKTLLTSIGGVGFTFAFRSLAIYRHWRMPKWLTLPSHLNG